MAWNVILQGDACRLIDFGDAKRNELSDDQMMANLERELGVVASRRRTNTTGKTARIRSQTPT